MKPIRVKSQPQDENIEKQPDAIDNNFDVDKIIENNKNKKKKIEEEEIHDIASQIYHQEAIHRNFQHKNIQTQKVWE